MNKEPVGLYILRLLMGAAMLGFMCMLYWSSVLVEEDLKNVHQELVKIRKEISDHSFVREEAKQVQQKKEEVAVTAQMNPDLPNLLQEDPFYTETLPKMLGENFQPKGKFQQATIGKPANLHPFSNWSQVSEWLSLCTVTAARNQFGKYETLAPSMAIKMEERNVGTPQQEFWIFLRDNVYWQPLSSALFEGDINLAPHFLEKHQVTAYDFKFYFDAIMNPYVQEPGALALRNYIGDIAEIEVVDKLTFIVRWKIHEIDGKPQILYRAKSWTGALRPLASWVYQYFPDGTKIVDDDSNPATYRTNSVWAQNFTDHWARNIIVSCGPWIFEGMNDERVKFRRNPNYFEPLAALVEGIEVNFKQSPENIWKDFKSNLLDTHTLQPNQIAELEDFLNTLQYQDQAKEGDAVERLDYIGRTYSYIGWNQAKPFFESRKVRQALTMSIDRNRIINQNLNGMAIPINGTFFRYSRAYDSSILPWPYDPELAKQMLAEEGWYDSDGDGIIDKEIQGKRVQFSFSLTYYVKNPTTKAICEYIATALKEVGINCKLNGVDIADLSATLEDKSFDAIALAWSLGSPPEEPRQLWYSSGAREKGSSNAVGFANKEADAIIDKLEFVRDPKERVALYHAFSRILHEEQPYTFLYTPKTVLLYRAYLQNVFIPADRQDLIPGADVAEPDSSIFWIKKGS